MEENIKLEKIKKSCSVGRKVTIVFSIIAIVGCVMALIAGITILKMGKEFDAKYEQMSNAGYVSVGDTIGGVRLLHFSMEDPSNLESDVPAIREAIKDHPYAISASITAFTAAAITGGGTLMTVFLVFGFIGYGLSILFAWRLYRNMKKKKK